MDGGELDFDRFWLDRPPRRALRALTELRRSLGALERSLVVEARRNRVTWKEIAADLGTHRQTVHRRYIADDPLAARRRALAAEREALMGGPPPL